MTLSKNLITASLLLASLAVQAQVLPTAELGIKIPLIKKPTTRPMTVAFEPNLKRYYIADGGLAPMASEFEAPVSKSEIHVYDASGKYMNSAKPGYDNRSIYYNANSKKVETITYNISSGAGFSPNTGIYALHLTETGELKDTSDEVMQFNPAFGDAATMPSFDAENNRYFAKQERSNKVWIVDPKQREKVAEITLDIAKAGAAFDDVSDHYVAYSGVKGEELVLIDVDHKAVLVFDLSGKFVAKSELPKDMKLRSQNHFNGTGYANGMLFVYHESEGEFGTYYGFNVVK
jgi:myo-inositol-hexaphosphate 3-phosphohydrolase